MIGYIFLIVIATASVSRTSASFDLNTFLTKVYKFEDTQKDLIGSSKDDCEDKHSACRYYKQLGYCKKTYVKFMTKNCKKTCNLCNVTPACTDRLPFCDYYKKNCNKGTVVDQYCPSTCGKCATAECGNAVKNENSVVNGKDAKKGSYPWQAAIFYHSSSGRKFICGGTLIDKTHVLSAAHCFHSGIDETKIEVVLGEHNRNYHESTEQTFRVRKGGLQSHKDYVALNSINDIAMLTLSSAAKMTEDVSIICLPKAGEVRPAGTNCSITGWGKLYAGSDSSPILQVVTVQVADQQACIKRNTRRGRIVTDGMMCTGKNDGFTFTSACHGDSGGPLSCKDNRKNPKKVWTLYGVVSWGNPQCNSLEAYNVFTRVSEYTEWIKEKQSK